MAFFPPSGTPAAFVATPAALAATPPPEEAEHDPLPPDSGPGYEPEPLVVDPDVAKAIVEQLLTVLCGHVLTLPDMPGWPTLPDISARRFTASPKAVVSAILEALVRYEVNFDVDLLTIEGCIKCVRYNRTSHAGFWISLWKADDDTVVEFGARVLNSDGWLESEVRSRVMDFVKESLKQTGEHVPPPVRPPDHKHPNVRPEDFVFGAGGAGGSRPEYVYDPEREAAMKKALYDSVEARVPKDFAERYGPCGPWMNRIATQLNHAYDGYSEEVLRGLVSAIRACDNPDERMCIATESCMLEPLKELLTNDTWKHESVLRTFAVTVIASLMEDTVTCVQLHKSWPELVTLLENLAVQKANAATSQLRREAIRALKASGHDLTRVRKAVQEDTRCAPDVRLWQMLDISLPLS